MSTLLLDQTLWDLCVDTSGGIAVATDPYAIAQDVATACRLFLGEYWYNTALGVPYFQEILGYAPPLALIKQKLTDAAAAVPGCNNPIVYVTGFADRELTGQVQFTNGNGETEVVAFGSTRLPLRDSSGNIMYDSSGNVMYGSG